LSSKLSYYRRLAGLTQAELAAKARFPQGQRRISYYEAGQRQPKLDDCRVLVAALNASGLECTLDDVFPPQTTAAPAGTGVA